MSVTLRLARRGTLNRPFYHIVATDSRKARDGRFIEKVGYYDPRKEPSVISFQEDRIRFWFEKGATLSNTVNNLLRKKNVVLARTTKPKVKKTKKTKTAKA